MSGQEFQTIVSMIGELRTGITHQLDEIETKLDLYGDRITRVEIATETNTKRIETVECAPAKKRENWKTWLAIIGGVLGIGAIVIPAILSLWRLFEQMKTFIGG